jgi:predicted Zn-ribbon and HTH transcriptional regulator
VEKFKRKRQLWKLRHGWEGSIKTDLKEIGWKEVDLIYLAEDRDDRRIVMKPSNCVKCGEFLDC